jgi:purine-nucleoside phosphorylase
MTITPSIHDDPDALAAAAAATIRARTGIAHFRFAITLGSGWKLAGEHLGETIAVIPAEDVPGFRPSAVVGHSGVLTAVRMGSGAHALVVGARTHLYEAHGVAPVVHPVRTAAALGARMMVLTNGAGGVKRENGFGHPVLISDHINLTAMSPLIGANFVDLTDLYSRRLRDIARQVDPGLAEGVYAQLPGPHYETAAEIRMLAAMGVDLVGMSTTLEAIAARQAGLEVLGVSLVTNLAAGIQETPLNHAEVLETGNSAQGRLGSLLARILEQADAQTATL